MLTPATNAFSPQQIPTTNSIGNTLIRQIGDVQDLALRECELHLLYCAVGEQADYADTQQGDNTDAHIHIYTDTDTQIQVHSWCQQPTQIHNKVTMINILIISIPKNGKSLLPNFANSAC